MTKKKFENILIIRAGGSNILLVSLKKIKIIIIFTMCASKEKNDMVIFYFIFPIHSCVCLRSEIFNLVFLM